MKIFVPYRPVTIENNSEKVRRFAIASSVSVSVPNLSSSERCRFAKQYYRCYSAISEEQEFAFR